MEPCQILKTFKLCGLEYECLDVGDGWQIAVTRHGGHVFGPFSQAYPEGIFWVPEEIFDPAAYRQLIEKKIWNIGGDRVWISPEIQFNIRDRAHFRETLDTPRTIDPGHYAMERRGNMIRLHQTLDLESYNTVTGQIHLDFDRRILKAENPLRKLPGFGQLMEGVSYCGFEQVQELRSESRQDIYAETWDLLQIRPQGILYIPMYQPLAGTDHYEPAGEHEQVLEHGVCLRITGQSRYKIAYKSACLTGRFGYLANPERDNSYLIIINYPNNPSAMYAEEPPLMEGETGYSIHIYNDDGHSGGFAEMECNLQTIGNPTGLFHTVDRVTKWIFTGNTGQLKKIARMLLGYGF